MELYFNLLKRNSPERGYYPEPTKIIIVVPNNNLEAGKLFGAHHGFKVFMGARYLGGYIGDDKHKCKWLKYRTDK